MEDAASWTEKIKSAHARQGSATEDVEMKPSGHASEISLNGRVIPLKSEKLRESFSALTAKQHEIAQGVQ